MTRLDWRGRTVALSVSALAGYLDAVGFIGSGGFFVSFMSGNSTRAGVGLAHGASPALAAACLVAAFVSGAFVCAALVHHTFRWRFRTVLGLVAVVLTAAAVAGAWMPSLAVFALVAFAMGAVNLLFEENGDVRVGLTYMTGTLVKLGNRLATAVTGGDRWSWLPFAAAWLALVAGAAVGASPSRAQACSVCGPRLWRCGCWRSSGPASAVNQTIRRGPWTKAARPRAQKDIHSAQ